MYGRLKEGGAHERSTGGKTSVERVPIVIVEIL